MKSKRLGSEIIRLALPATIENVFQTLVGFFDTLLIAQLGLVAVTAVGLANTILNVYLAVFLAIGVGGTALIARSLGAGQKEKAKQYARQTQELSIAGGIVFGFISIFFGRWMLQAMGASGSALEDAQVFFYWVGGFSLLHASMTSLGTILRATGDTVTPMKVGIITNVTNVLLDYFLIFGFGSWDGLGILGTALGTIFARLLGCYLLTREVQKSELALSFQKSRLRKDYQELVHLTIPVALERLVMRLGQVIYFSLIVALGTTVYASHMIAGNIESFTYMPAYGLATAAAVLIGQSLGKGDISTVRKVAFLSSAYGVVIMSLLFFLYSPMTAITSISTFTSRGKRATSTAERAGNSAEKAVLYTSLNATKSFMSFKKQVVFTTWSKSVPASDKIAPIFFKTCSVCS